MKPTDVYQLYPITLTSGKGSKLTDDKGKNYIDFYGGHGVISIGHSHPNFVESVTQQLQKLAFYSNAFQNPLQDALAEKLGKCSGYENYSLFLSNSGAEANENALKVASFVTGRNKVLAVKGAFHGRTAGAVAVTDNPKIRANFGSQLMVDFVTIDSTSQLTEKLLSKEYAAFIIEGIQGVNGVWEAESEYWKLARLLCTQTATLLVADEIQSGYGRSGRFFAHQLHGIQADLVTIAKGMGNGFPVAGTLISDTITLQKGMLGTTFGGGHLACAAALSVLEVIDDENLLQHVQETGKYLSSQWKRLHLLKAVRGRGLMWGLEFHVSAKIVRQRLLEGYGIITGYSEPDTLRILPPLNVSKTDVDYLLNSLETILNKEMHIHSEILSGY